jgi:hypothetical protein
VDTSSPGGVTPIAANAASLSTRVDPATNPDEDETGGEDEVTIPTTPEDETPLVGEEDVPSEEEPATGGTSPDFGAVPGPVPLDLVAPAAPEAPQWTVPPRSLGGGAGEPIGFESAPEAPDDRNADRRDYEFAASGFEAGRAPSTPTWLTSLRDDLAFLSPETGFADALDDLQESVAEREDLVRAVAGSGAAMTAGLSLGYLVWLTRGGLLIASMASSIPVWRLVDPIPILASLALAGTDEEDEDESLGSMLHDGEDDAADVEGPPAGP